MAKENDDTVFTNDFTINLASSLAMKCSIAECPVDSMACPFGITSEDTKACACIVPSQWVRILRERVH